MSFLRKQDAKIIAPSLDCDTTFFLELAPKMVPTSEFNMATWNAQLDTIQKQQGMQNDLNKIHSLAMTKNAEVNAYTMSKPFTALARVEDMIPVLKKNGLTLRLNIKRPHAHVSNHTCMELSADHLSNLLAESADAAGLKTIQLRTKADAVSEPPTHGDMFVTLVQTDKGHVFSHVDYEITEEHDHKLHSNQTSITF